LQFVVFSLFFPYFLTAIGRCDVGQAIMTIKDLAAYLKLTEKTAYRLAAEGKIPGFKVGGAWRFQEREIDRWISQQSAENTKNSPTRKSQTTRKSI